MFPPHHTALSLAYLRPDSTDRDFDVDFVIFSGIRAEKIFEGCSYP